MKRDSVADTYSEEAYKRFDRKKKPPKLSEAHIERTCTQILAWDGWRSFKMEENFSERKQKRTGEKGMADRLYIRYEWPGERKAIDIPTSAACCELLWIEWKALDGRPSAMQWNWHQTERRAGALTLIAGEDFRATIEGFREWYAQSGLQRRKS